MKNHIILSPSKKVNHHARKFISKPTTRLFGIKNSILFAFIFSFFIHTSKSQTGVTNYAIPNPMYGYLYCFKVDAQGNKWIGNKKGLIKFDVVNFTHYDSASSGLVDNYIYDVAFDVFNNIWIVTRRGLSKYDGTSWTTYNTSNSSLPNDTVNCIYAQGSIVFVGTNNGAARFNGTSWNVYNSSNSGLSSTKVNCIALDLNNDLFIGTSRGLFKKSGNNWTNYATLHPYFTANMDVRCIYIDASNDKWICSYNNPYKLIGNNIVSLNSIYPYMPYASSQYSKYSITKGPMGGVMLNVGNHLLEIVNSQLYYYLGTSLWNTTQITFDNVGGLIWLVNSNMISSFNYLNYTYDNPLQSNTSSITSSYLDVNEVKARLLNQGDMFWYPSTNKLGYEVPKNSGRHATATSALWIGGKDNGEVLHEAAQEYRIDGNDYWPGPLDTINGTIDSATSAIFNRIWKIDRLKLEEFRTQFALGNVQNGTYTVTNDIIEWPAVGTGNITRNLAPFVDVNHDGLYRPLVDGDYPKIKGDQMLYWIFNDALSTHGQSGGLPFKVEVHASAYAFACPTITDSLDVLNYTTFYDYKIINRSTDDYHKTYIGFWQDGGIGYAFDDFIACKPSSNYSMFFNGNGFDGNVTNELTSYGTKPPMNSTVVLNGPLAVPNDGIDNDNNGITDELGEKNLMTDFVSLSNEWYPIGYPQVARDYYLYSASYWKDSIPITYGGDGRNTNSTNIPTRFMFDGALNDTLGWTEAKSHNYPYLRSSVIGCGPFNLNAGQSVEFELAEVFTRDTLSNYSIANLYEKNLADVQRVQKWYAVDSFPSCLSIYTGIAQQPSVHTSDVIIFPNPFTTTTTIEFGATQPNTSIKLFDMLGHQLRTINVIGHQCIIEKGNLEPGIYFVQITNQDHTIINRKLMVE